MERVPCAGTRRAGPAVASTLLREAGETTLRRPAPPGSALSEEAGPTGPPPPRAEPLSADAARESRRRIIEAILEVSARDPPPLLGIWRRASSTNELAKSAAVEAAGVRCEGSVFLAEEQTAGKGRYGRHWVSPFGGLYLSLLTMPPGRSGSERLGRLALLPIAAGLALAEAVRRTCGAPAAIRWPNDLDLGQRKIAGVLAETGFVPARPALAVVGFGINCAPVALGSRARPARPPGCLPEGVDRARLAAALVGAFRETAALWARDPAALRARWEARSPSSRGCRCRVRLAEGVWIAGSTDGTDPGGGLRIRCDDGGRRVIHAAEALRVEHQPADPARSGPG